MAMVSMQLRPAARASAPFGANGPASLDETGISAGASPARPGRQSIEEQRERAQREFKRIWNLCAPPQ
ncbi:MULTISPECIES: hypothetical protein [Methylobacterium]|uniref:hypothetical protein n=1 Tax=Methylobacterium TaxID=407 RepID=UPI0013EA3376|nr:hypothetical protein [Methylobacterium sp. DB0501]NGM34022.1 hypothetical protein [Methylobacterium sp. DB0501]